jgi:signal transduction histidine kinase
MDRSRRPTFGSVFAHEGEAARERVDPCEEQRLEERLILADRLASVGTLAAGVAHEINNPLAAVIANLAVLESELDRVAAAIAVEPADRAEASAALASLRAIAHETQEGAGRVRDIVERLKMVARRDARSDGASELSEVLESALTVVGAEIRARARLVRRIEPLPAVAGSEPQLGQVFVNLLSNAAQAIEAGAPEANEITVAAYRGTGGTVVVEVRDTGCGIAPAAMARLFDPFFTTKPVGTGTGLGLAVCIGILESLGGRIDVESEVGRGSVFRVTLPAARG